MNEDITLDEVEDEPSVHSGQLSPHRESAVLATVAPGCDPAELNPRNYAFLPSTWTQKIRPAGRAIPADGKVGNPNKAPSLQGILC